MYNLSTVRSIRLRTLLRSSRSRESVFLSENVGDLPPRGLGVRHFQVILLSMALAMNALSNLTPSIVQEILMQDDPSYQAYKDKLQTGLNIFAPFTYVISGYLSTRLSNKYLIAGAVFLKIVSINLTPWALGSGKLDLYAFLRFTNTFANAFVDPCVFNILTQWVPDEEECLLIPLALTGLYLGLGIGFLSVVELSASSGGLSSPLHFSTFFSVVWFIAYLGLGAQEPRLCWFISKNEERYIKMNSAHKTQGLKRKRIPYCSILTSLPIYALVVAHTSLRYTIGPIQDIMIHLLTESYSSLQRAYTVVGVRYLSVIIHVTIITLIAHYLIMKRYLTKKTLRYISNGIGLAGTGVSLILMLEWESYMFLYFLSGFLEGFVYLGFRLNFFDVLPNYIGLVVSWCSCIAALLLLTFTPLTDGLIENFGMDVAMAAVFQISGLLLILGNLFFMMFASVETEPFNYIQDEDDEPI